MPSRRRRPSPTVVLLVRHGLTPTTGHVLPGRAPGLHLSDKGRAQADEVAERIAALPKVDAVYSSPMERTRETAAPIAERLGVRVKIDKALLECDTGDWTGEELKALRRLAAWKVVQTHPGAFTFPGGESLASMQLRVATWLRSMPTHHPGGTIVAVTHADPIRAAVADALGTPLDLFERIIIGTASVTAIAYSASGMSALLTTNAYGSLTALGAKS